jgi:hypothetical protein
MLIRGGIKMNKIVYVIVTYTTAIKNTYHRCMYSEIVQVTYSKKRAENLIIALNKRDKKMLLKYNVDMDVLLGYDSAGYVIRIIDWGVDF